MKRRVFGFLVLIILVIISSMNGLADASSKKKKNHSSSLDSTSSSTNSSTGTNTDSSTGSNTKSNTEANTNSGTSSGTSSNTDTSTNSGTSSGTDTSTETNTNSSTDTSTGSQANSTTGTALEVPAKMDASATQNSAGTGVATPGFEIPANLGMAISSISFDYKEENVVSTKCFTSKDGTCTTWFLMYSRSEDIVKAITSVFEADINSGEVKIAESPTTNAIIIRSKDPGSPIVKNMLEVISSLDFRPGQVLIDVLVVELTVTDTDLFDFELKTLVDQPLGLNNTLNTTTIDNGTIENANPNSTTSGFKSFITSQNKMKLFLNASQKKERANIVSSPHIVAANHKKATFKIGSKIPLITGVRPSDAGPIKTFEIKDVGIELNVTPHINRSNQIDLDVSQIINGIVSYDPKEGTAQMSNREVTTNVTLNDNNTLILGGFIESKQNNTTNKVPGLSDIPFLGKLFKQKQKTDNKTELLIFITPRIIDSREDEEKLMAFHTSKLTFKDKVEKLLKDNDIKNFEMERNQEVLIGRASRDWKYDLNTRQADVLVWQIPPELDFDKVQPSKKGACPFAYGPSKRLRPPFIRTLLEPNDGVLFRKDFQVENPGNFKSLSLRVASNNAAAVYLNGKLIDEDPAMKLKDGHDYEYWNRDPSNIPANLLTSGNNTVVVLLGSDKSAHSGYFDMMLLGNKN
ncbi:MAG: hypothetical protein HQM08_05000 [Candidatus Riflebacteria bacterium]|nr:hypothetical protein [Candidatus Riflebacteria bacterium]